MKEKVKVLYVEDELALAHIVRDMLQRQGYQIQLITDGAQVMDALTSQMPDICVLDVMLPNVDGFTLGKQISQNYPQIPILYLTAKGQVEDVVQGFKSGGRDYLRKPFSMEELLVRLENLRSFTPKQKEESVYNFSLFQLVPNKLLLKYKDRNRKLTYREMEVLIALVENKNEIIQKRKLLQDIWGDDTLSNSRSLDVYIRKLREYLSEDDQIEIITLRGVGYRFNIG